MKESQHHRHKILDHAGLRATKESNTLQRDQLLLFEAPILSPAHGPKSHRRRVFWFLRSATCTSWYLPKVSQVTITVVLLTFLAYADQAQKARFAFSSTAALVATTLGSFGLPFLSTRSSLGSNPPFPHSAHSGVSLQ